jgi:hypothetical protein
MKENGAGELEYKLKFSSQFLIRTIYNNELNMANNNTKEK